MAIAEPEEPFRYTGPDGPPVPNWATRVRVDPVVVSIPEKAFHYRPNQLRHVDLCDGLQTIGRAAFFDCSALESIGIPRTVEKIPDECFQHCGELRTVELQEGLREIGMHAFDGCTSLGHITLPGTVRTVGKNAFFNSVSSLALPDGLGHIGEYAFSQCKLPCLKIPPRISEVPLGALRSCKNVFTLELPEGVEDIGQYAFASCQSLRNVFVPTGADIADNAFLHCTDLEKVFGSFGEITEGLRNRFDGLPVHRMCYYQSYHPERAVEHLKEAMDATCELPDGLGMTPLHILACSSTQNLELYRVMVERYPDTLVAKDKWECLPILYAFWRQVPADIIRYLIESLKWTSPDYELNWDTMVETLSKANVPHGVIRNLCNARLKSFPDQRIEWDAMLNKLAEPIQNWAKPYVPVATFRYLVSLSVEERVAAIGLRSWRTYIFDSVSLIRDGHRTRKADLASFQSKVAHWEEEYRKLKEATTTLELFLWKAKISEMDAAHRNNAERRSRCRIGCQADNVIECVLPYLLPSSDGMGSRLGQYI